MKTDVDEFEKFYGMLLWETSFPPIKGSVKENYSDFIVEEIQPDGTILSVKDPILTPSGYEGLFTHFVLIKEGIGNYEAIWLLAKRLGVPTSWFSYYGNKDREALTVQRVAVWGVDPKKLLDLEPPKGVKIVSPIRELRRLHVGQHLGNNFRIKIRDINTKHMDSIINFMEESKKGLLLPNFFGYQRFGVTKPVSAIIGKLLLKKKYKDAITIYLTFPSIYDDDRLLEAKKLIKEGEYKEALRLYPRRGFLFERILIKNILKGWDTIKILKKLPKFLLRMFIEAYQSYIFNKTLSIYRMDGGNYTTESGSIFRLPLLGYNTKIKQRNVKELIDVVLDEENINLSMFRNKYIPSLSLEGTTRRAALKFRLSKINYIEKENSLEVEFKLGKGEFATIILREIFKHNILTALYSKLVRRFGEKEFRSKISEIIKMGKIIFRGC